MALPPEAEYPQEIRDQLTRRAKMALRKRMKAVRATIPPEAIAERSERIVQRVIALESYITAKNIALFVAMPHEVNLNALALHAHAAGKHVAVPVVMPEDPTLVFRSWMHGEKIYPLEKSAWGIEEPTEQSPVMPYDQIDVLMVAALGVGENGHRLGYGKGHYDRIIPRCTRAKSIVVAFDFQMLAEIPVFESDRACDIVVTDRHTIVIS